MQPDRHLASGDLSRESAPLGHGSISPLLVDLRFVTRWRY
jgi:hypothetical protein